MPPEPTDTQPPDPPMVPPIDPEHHLQLARYFASRWLRNLGGEIEFDDLFQLGCIGLVKAARTYSPDRGTKFVSYAARVIEHEILIELRKVKRHRHQEHLDDPAGCSVLGNLLPATGFGSCAHMHALTESGDTLTEVLEVISTLTEREQRILTMYYFDNCNQHQIAKEVGISQAHVSKVLRKALQEVKQQLRAMAG